MKNRTTNTIYFAVFILFIIFAYPVSVLSKENACIDNVAFMKDVDEKIKNKFPMCDEFLNVSWIVEEKVTGLLKYDIFDDNCEKVASNLQSIVSLQGERPYWFYETNKYQLYQGEDWRARGVYVGEIYTNNNIDELVNFIKKSEIFNTIDHVLETGHSGKRITLFAARVRDHIKNIKEDLIISNVYSLACHQKTLCVLFQNSERAFIFEYKIAGNVKNKEYLNNLSKQLASDTGYQASDSLFYLGDHYVLDLNLDNIDDYIGSINFISKDNKYILINGFDDIGLKRLDKIRNYQFSEICGSSKDYWYAYWSYLTTDGNNYYVNNYCNLSPYIK
ncbi:hypothetical protein [Desulfobulbus oralis]|uniref:hypothetical protein n=1 Tax=Desulfobulbus oralis TaxID=1986146 RepID=UPI0011B0D8C3|nr:hypothetical protein [Desulfobulbus oralis]